VFDCVVWGVLQHCNVVYCSLLARAGTGLSRALTCEWGNDLHLDEDVLLRQHPFARGSVVVSAGLQRHRKGAEECRKLLKEWLLRCDRDNSLQYSRDSSTGYSTPTGSM